MTTFAEVPTLHDGSGQDYSGRFQQAIETFDQGLSLILRALEDGCPDQRALLHSLCEDYRGSLLPQLIDDLEHTVEREQRAAEVAQEPDGTTERPPTRDQHPVRLPYQRRGLYQTEGSASRPRYRRGSSYL